MKSIHTKLSEKTDLEKFYGEYKDIQPSLLCNQNKSERYNKHLLDNSPLLNNEVVDTSFINRNQSDTIYQRNIPGKKQPVNIDIRPISSNTFENARFIKENEELQNYNKYEVSLRCDDNVFMPAHDRGTISKFFNNIDVDSELRNINYIDTKCATRLFKIDPNDKKSKLSCYSDDIVKDYQTLESNVGSSWKNYQHCGKLEKFDICSSKKFQSVNPNSNLSIYDNMPKDGKFIKSEISTNETINQMPPQVRNEVSSMKMLEQQENIRKQQIANDLKLLQEKQDLTLLNTLDRNRVKYASVPKPDDITQFKGNSPLNVYAPIIRNQKVDTELAQNLGKQSALDIQLDEKIKKRLSEFEKKIEVQYQKYNPNPKNLCELKPIKEPEIYPFQFRGQTRHLYKFNKIVKDAPPCLYSEQLFNNQTKRKHISVGRIPSHIYNN
jgi:hypothetical protein